MSFSFISILPLYEKRIMPGFSWYLLQFLIKQNTCIPAYACLHWTEQWQALLSSMHLILSTTATKGLRAHLSNKKLHARPEMCYEKVKGGFRNQGRKFTDGNEKRRKKWKQMKNWKARKSKCSLEVKTWAKNLKQGHWPGLWRNSLTFVSISASIKCIPPIISQGYSQGGWGAAGTASARSSEWSRCSIHVSYVINSKGITFIQIAYSTILTWFHPSPSKNQLL